jgi:hypothetical protein
MSGNQEPVIKHTSQVIYATLDSEKKAYIKYSVEGNVMKLISTYTPPEFRGRGIAGKLVEYAIKLAENNNWLIEPICSYAVYYFMKNKEKRYILVDRFKNMNEEEWKKAFEEALGRERGG